MMSSTFVIGGARSGKSSYAERIAREWSEKTHKQVTYIATAQVSDAEMEQRIDRHRGSRPGHWRTIEEPMQVAGVILAHGAADILLVDCLSLLLNNWMFLEHCTETSFFERLDELVHALKTTSATVILVSNEVGQGIVPADEITRQYRDWLGWLNQAVASASASVVLVVAGIPVDVRKLEAML